MNILVGATVALSAAVTFGVVRLGQAHLDVETARHGADLTALSVASGADEHTSDEVARINGVTIVVIDAVGDVTTVTVRRGGAMARASAAVAAIR